jgi:hypothetical protein
LSSRNGAITCTSGLIFEGRAANHTVNTAGKTISGTFTINSSGGTCSLLSDINVSIMNLTAGTFTSGIYNITSTQFAASTTQVRVLNMGSGTWSFNTTSSATYFWNIINAANLTINCQIIKNNNFY